MEKAMDTTMQEKKEAFEKKLKAHDWYYKMSDSIKAFDKGEREEFIILQKCKKRFCYNLPFSSANIVKNRKTRVSWG